MRKGLVCVAAFAALVLLTPAAPAQSPARTRIQVSELCCKNCVKKIATRVTKVPGVASVQGDLASATLFINHRPGSNPSPRALWEAVEQANHEPTRLEGPSGTFTAKPQS